MEYIFWILLVLFFAFLGLSVITKRKTGKTKLRYVIPTVVFMVPVLLLVGMYVVYHTQLKPQPTISTVSIGNEDFQIGHATKVLLFAVLALFAPLIAPHDPYQVDFLRRLQPPAWMPGGERAHLLGCDALGRDILSRIIFGARVSILIGLLVGGAGDVRGRNPPIAIGGTSFLVSLPTVL